MKLIYYISTPRLTSSIISQASETAVPVLNETLRPHLEGEEQEGDHAHADLEEAKRLARDIVFDLGDKAIDVLAISVEDDVFDSLTASGDIRDSSRTDPYGGRLLKLSRQACITINGCCTFEPLRWVVPQIAADPEAPHTVN